MPDLQPEPVPARMKIVSGASMRAIDAATIAAGVSERTLMWRAGMGCTDHVLRYAAELPLRPYRRFCIVTGKGNNGGDGFVIAQALAAAGQAVALYALCPPTAMRGAARHFGLRLPRELRIQPLSALQLKPDDVVVDCLLGTGVNGPPRDPYRHAIEFINASGCSTIAIDLPSGVNANTGACELAIRADLTITIGCWKYGLFHGPGARHRGMLRLVEIGLSAKATTAARSMGIAFDWQAGRQEMQRIPFATHKGEMGRVTVIGGSKDYPNAPLLSGAGALRAGAGLVSVMLPGDVDCGGVVPRALMLRRGATPHTHAPLPSLDALRNQNVIVIGPGLSRDQTAAALVLQLIDSALPLVVDADALAAVPAASLPRSSPWILTPHPGEMAHLIDRLGGAWPKGREPQALELAARTGAIVVLKGACTVVAHDGRATLNTSGTPALATGGSGDVLAGLIAGFAASGQWYARTQLATFVHGLAAELAAPSQRAFIADDLLTAVPRAIQEIRAQG